MLGTLPGGEKVVAVRTSSADGSGIAVYRNDLQMAYQPRPLEIQYYGGVGQMIVLEGSYASIDPAEGGMLCKGSLSPGNGAEFLFEDTWNVENGNLNLSRKVQVRGDASGGFTSAFYICLFARIMLFPA